jgi:hypothetical protein
MPSELSVFDFRLLDPQKRAELHTALRIRFWAAQQTLLPILCVSVWGRRRSGFPTYEVKQLRFRKDKDMQYGECDFWKICRLFETTQKHMDRPRLFLEWSKAWVIEKKKCREVSFYIGRSKHLQFSSISSGSHRFRFPFSIHTSEPDSMRPLRLHFG